ncbi:WD40 repeat-like protein [Lentinula guzmanii]|uniref:WD40 repeat-like protein n=1 Tax=Lentinula guzmanii TaxID=2804957 RepID=A0AA38JDL1_9AGAR|nr:WD40 repeat-like protein [Lentinula guzmanii]
MASFNNRGGFRHSSARPLNPDFNRKFHSDLPMNSILAAVDLEPEQTSQQQQQHGASQTLYMPIDSPPTPAPSPGPNIMAIVHGERPSPSFDLSARTTTAPISPLALPQNPVLRRQYLSAVIHACNPTELLFISTTIAPLLKRDFLRALPTELALHVLGFVDSPKTLARAAQVSHRWWRLISDEALWKRMCVLYAFDKDKPHRNCIGQSQRKGKDRMPLVEDDEHIRSGQLSAMLRNRSTSHPTYTDSFSYQEHFKYSYSIMQNWHNGGHLLRAHKVPASSTNPESGVVTSLALDEDWVVVGLANCRIHVFSARTGVLARTLVGHDSGVWAVCLVHKGGYMGGPDCVRQQEGGSGTRNGKRRKRKSTRESQKGEDYEEIEETVSRSPRRPEARSRHSEGDVNTINSNAYNLSIGGHTSRWATTNHTNVNASSDADPPLNQFIPPSLRIALGLKPVNDDPNNIRADCGGEEEESDWDDQTAWDEHSVFDEDAEVGDVDMDEGSPGTGSRRQSRYPGKPSNVTGSSDGWGQPGALVVSGGCDKVVRVWDIRSGYCIYVLHGHTSTIRCIKVLHNRPIAVSGSRDNTLRVWDVQRGRSLRVLAGHVASVRCLDVCGNRVVSGSYDNTCRLWDVDTGECLHVLRGHLHQIYSVTFDGVRIASGGLDTTVRVWDAETGECKATLQGHTALVCQLQLSPTMLATGGSDGRVIMFSLPPLHSSNQTHRHPHQSHHSEHQANQANPFQVLHRIAAHDSSVTALQFDQRFLVTGGNDGRVRLFETQTGNYVRDLSEPSESVWKVAYGPGAEGCVIMCRRQGKTIMEFWSLKPREGRVDVERDRAEREKERIRIEEERNIEPVLDC